jgi:2,3-bisphosphoglycerate-independent phosphoglycerate mutase
MVARTPCLDDLLGAKLSRELAPVTTPSCVFRPLDATLGVPGLPQSATGQSTLLTGVNAAELMGCHYGPWPGPVLRELLDEGSLFAKVQAAGGNSALANVYPPGFFEALEKGRRRLNAPVYGARAAGVSLRTLEDYARAEAISADLSGSYLHALDARIPPISPEEAGKRLARLAKDYSFTFFDFWLSDYAGHRWSFGEAVTLVETLDAFFAGLVAALDGVTLVVTSDHGNLEDKRTSGHTLSPVPLIAMGETAGFLEAGSLLDVAPAILSALEH